MSKSMEELLRDILKNQADTDSKIEALGKNLEKKIVEAIDPLNKRLDEAERDREGLRNEVSNLREGLQEVRGSLINREKSRQQEVEIVGSVVGGGAEWGGAGGGGAGRGGAGGGGGAGRSGDGGGGGDRGWEVAGGRRYVASGGAGREPGGEGNLRTAYEVNLEKSDIKYIMNKAARTVSLFPVPWREVEEIRKELVEEAGVEGIDCSADALRKAAREYMEGELKMSSKDWESLDIEGIFAPQNQEWNTIYVEMRTQEQAEWILSHSVHLLSRDLKVGNHVPWRARERHSAFQTKAWKRRDGGKFKTRVYIKNGDYVLKFRRKDLNTGPWETWYGDDDTPDFSSQQEVTREKKTPSKATGRNMRTKRGEKHGLSPASAEAEVPSHKRPNGRGEEPEEEVVCEAVEEEDETETGGGGGGGRDDREDGRDWNCKYNDDGTLAIGDGGVFTGIEFTGTNGGRRESVSVEYIKYNTRNTAKKGGKDSK